MADNVDLIINQTFDNVVINPSITTEVVDINVSATNTSVDIIVNPNLTIVNINELTGGGGGGLQGLQSVTDYGAITTTPTSFTSTDPDFLDVKSLYASTDNGFGIYAIATAADGKPIYAQSTSQSAVKGVSTFDGTGVEGHNTATGEDVGVGVSGSAIDGIAIAGTSTNGIGGSFSSTTGTAIRGIV